MPRRPREDVAGALHHVWARGNRRELIFRDDLDRLRYLVLLGAVVARFEWRCLAYCLMGNHMHLVIESPHGNVGVGMHRLHGEYATGFNRRHRVTGHVFQDRYGSRRVTSDAQLWQLVKYIERNPVEARLCGRPEQWRWGSRGAVHAGTAPAWLDVGRLGALGVEGAD